MIHEEFDTIAALSAVGAASAVEERSLEEHVRSCRDCGHARDEYAEAVTMIARSLDPVPPPAELRDRVIAAAETKSEDERRRFGINVWWLATAATLFLAMWGWREFGIRVSRERIRSQRAEIEQLAEQNRTLAQQRDRLAAEMAAIAAGNTHTISLSGQEMSPSASARVFLEPEQRRAIVFFNNLPANPSDKSYQLWIIRADQPKPESAGVFDAKNGTAAITIENLPIESAIKALAVTLEKRGGSEQPTSAKFYVMGNT